MLEINRPALMKSFVTLCIALSAPAAIADEVTLQSAWFSGSYTVYKDLGLQGPYTKSWFMGNGSPILYVVNDDVKVSSVFFESNPPNWLDLTGYVVHGYVGGNLVYTSDALVDPTTPHQATFDTQSGFPGALTIDWWEDFTILWKLELPGTPISYTLGSSENNIFFVSLAPTGLWPTYYSVLYYACEGARGEDGSNPSALADGIFAEFSDRMVPRAQELLGGGFPIPMTYYLEWETPYPNVGTLLRHRDSQCGGWNQFFYRCVNTAGFDLFNEHVTVCDSRGPCPPDPNNPPAPGEPTRPFFVNDWSFGFPRNPDKDWNNEFPYINIPDGDSETWFNDDYYPWLHEDVSDIPGIPSQGGVTNPASIFDVHFVTQVNEKYYDPSYGVTYTSLSNMEDTAIAGYSASFGFYVGAGKDINELELMVDLNGDGDIDNVWVEVPVFYIQENDPTTDMLAEDRSNPQR